MRGRSRAAGTTTCDLARARRGVRPSARPLSSWAPDRILIACNTCSESSTGTRRSSRAAAVPVDGIIDAGVSLLAETMQAEPSAGLVLFGTKTTIESGVHYDALVARGVDPHRLRAVHCHGLAGAIRDPASAAVSDELIGGCAARVADRDPGGVPALRRPVLYALRLCRRPDRRGTWRRAPPARAAAQPQRPDGQRPGAARRRGRGGRAGGEGDGGAGGGAGEGRGVNKTAGGGASDSGGRVRRGDLESHARRGGAQRRLARLVEPVSPATAQALLSYSLRPQSLLIGSPLGVRSKVRCFPPF